MLPTLTAPCPAPLPGLCARVVAPRIWDQLPIPGSGKTCTPFPAPAPLPPWPSAPAAAVQAALPSWPAGLSALPSPAPPPAPFETFPQQIVDKTPPPSNPQRQETDFTDEDLREALGPILQNAVQQAARFSGNGIDAYFEPMLRATMRRTMAEQSSGTRPFHAPGAFDRLIWHLQALFTSRTYEDIFFEKTHRFQVEEVFLVDTASLALVSFASSDPARHASAKRVTSAVQRIALQLRDDEGKLRENLELGDQRHAISRQGRFAILIAVVRGQTNELLIADLEFALHRIEDRFREQFQSEGSPLLHALQPFLEDCVLIQAPASAA